MDPQSRTADEVIAQLARPQHGVVTRRQMVDAGLSADQIRTRRRKGTLLPVFRGVYRVGHEAPSVEASYLAAVLACGPGSLLSGRAAGRLYGVVKGPWPSPRVTTPTERRIPGIRTRRSRTIDRRDATMYR